MLTGVFFICFVVAFCAATLSNLGVHIFFYHFYNENDIASRTDLSGEQKNNQKKELKIKKTLLAILFAFIAFLITFWFCFYGLVSR